jgi:hypothetical protein
MQFDWNNDRYSYTVSEVGSSYSASGSASLNHGDGIKSIKIRNKAPADTNDEDTVMWFDDIKFR